MSKHTVGPWHVRPPTRENPSRAVVSAMSGFTAIYDAPLTSETEANALLIAAAPDYYEAADAIQEYIVTHKLEGEGTDCLIPASLLFNLMRAHGKAIPE